MSIQTSLGETIQNKPAQSLQQPKYDGAHGQEEALSSAWRYEMERAQFENWFKPFDAGPSPLADRVGAQISSGLDHKSQAAMRATPRLGGLLENSGVPSTAYPNLERGTNAVPDRPSTVDASTDQTVTSHVARPSSANTSLNEAANPLFGVPPVAGVPRSLGSLPGSGNMPAPNFHAASKVSEEAGLRPVQVPVFAEARALPKASNSFDAIWASRSSNAVKSDASQESSESATGASMVRGQSVSMASEAVAPPVRLHVQWQGQSASIWLGMDGSAEHVSSQIQIVIAELQRHFAATGQRIGRIVCNGAVVFEGHSSKAGRADNPFATRVDTQLKAQSQKYPNVNSDRSEHPAPNPQEDI